MTPTTPEAMILEALLVRLHELVLTPALPIAEPNVTLEPAPARYLRAALMPNVTMRMTINSDGPNHHFGIFQVTVVWETGVGELHARETAGLVADHFSADTKMVFGGISVRSTKRPDVAPSMPQDESLVTPVSVEYEAYI